MASTVVQQLVKPKPFRRGLDLGPPHPVADKPVETLPAPERLYVPVKQHRGAWCESKVQPGDLVKKGQVLAESADLEAAPVHSPVSGKVASVGEHVDPFGRKIPTITIDNDGAEEWVSEPVTNPDYMNMKVSAMFRAIRQSGLVQARTGRPVHSLLAPPERPKAYIFLVGIPIFKPAELFIVNTLDTEPTLAANHRLLSERAGELGDGIGLIQKLTGAKKGIITVNAGGGDLPQSLHDTVKGGIDLMPVQNRYPVAVDELLVTAVTGQEVPWPGGDTRDIGTLVLDLESLMGILDAVKSGRPQLDKIVSVVGPGLEPRNFRVPLGTPIGDVVTAAGGSFEDAAKIVMGGLMEGAAQFASTAPVTKQTRGVAVLQADDLTEITEQLCIKCGRCVSICPMRILPKVTSPTLIEFGFFAEAEAAELDKCIECGCCSYVCPARRPLIHIHQTWEKPK